MHYRMADCDDIDLLVLQRLSFIEVNENSNNYSEIKDSCYHYFHKALADNTCDVVLAEDNGKCVGTGVVFYYDSVPSVLNVTGKNAYITNMYVEPDYRGRSIGTAIITRLIEKAKERDYKIIMLNASDMGKPLYKKIGFAEINHGMILDVRKI